MNITELNLNAEKIIEKRKEQLIIMLSLAKQRIRISKQIKSVRKELEALDNYIIGEK